ncbi:hypothetical protein BD311DRAFT_660132 [Dichomitus squalens]|uniref:Uncharacterized protein n=1 Tax=Dichomitus squalens TaxID=114155 RepID=A0A4Q9MR02_9APHY|nr:hypothetical protein BD311DRAFT_660132 [Dichomitus squalens]
MDTVDIPFDSIWCPVCSRQIVPKRISVPIQPQPTPAPPASPTATQPKTSPREDAPARLTRGKTGTIRPRAQGLVHGTGRVKPNGAIKRSPTKDASQDATSGALPPTKPAAPVRHRTMIDQTPAPLYCSDECRLADLQSYHSAIDIKYNPERCASPRLPPVPPNSVSDIHGSQDDSDCSSGASYESRSSTSSPITTSAVVHPPTPKGDCGADAYSRLSAIYGFAPLPPPPPFTRKAPKASEESAPRLEGGVMMAARRIQAALCPEKPKKSSWGVPVHSDPEDDNKPIPGWTDGSNAWRASVYGFAPPRDFTRSDPDDAAIRAYGSYVASPHRSRGVHSTLGENKPAAEVKPSASTPSLPSRVVDSSTQELYRQYSASFTRRSESRSSLVRGVPLSTSPTGSARSSSAREFSLLKPGAEGRLLVPDVKMRRVNSSVSSIGGSSGTSWGSQSAIFSAGSVAGRKRSPLSRQNSDVSVDTAETQSEGDEYDAREAACSMPAVGKARPTATMRTWSYSSETFTYPIMRTAPKKEKRIERRVVDGVEQDVEVEVEVEEPIKRLFLFGGARD